MFLESIGTLPRAGCRKPRCTISGVVCRGRGSVDGGAGVVPIPELHGRIAERLGNEENWLLLGGPPCQAYSLMGRARMTGIGHEARSASDPEASERVRRTRLEAFGIDVRHTLYQEYLRIIAVHQPAIFVMENVKGKLSAKVPGTDDLMFDRIRADLVNPWEALAGDPNLEQLKRPAVDCH